MSSKNTKQIEIKKVVDDNSVYTVTIKCDKASFIEEYGSSWRYETVVSLTKSKMDKILEDLDKFINKWRTKKAEDNIDSDFDEFDETSFNMAIKNSLNQYIENFLGEIKLPYTNIVLDKKYENLTYPIEIEYENRKWTPEIHLILLHESPREDQPYESSPQIVQNRKIFYIKLNDNLIKLLYLKDFYEKNKELGTITNKKKFISRTLEYLNKFIISTDIPYVEKKLEIDDKKSYELTHFLQWMATESLDTIIENELEEIFIEIFDKIIYLLLGDFFNSIYRWIRSKFIEIIIDKLKLESYESFLLDISELQNLLENNEEKLINNYKDLEKDLKNYQKEFSDLVLSFKINIPREKFKELGKLIEILESGVKIFNVNKLDEQLNLILSIIKFIQDIVKVKKITKENISIILETLKDLVKLSEDTNYYNNFLEQIIELFKYLEYDSKIKDNDFYDEIERNTFLGYSLVKDFTDYLDDLNIEIESNNFDNLNWIKQPSEKNVHIKKILEEIDYYMNMENNLGYFLTHNILKYFFEISDKKDPDNIIRYFKISKFLCILNNIKNGVMSRCEKNLEAFLKDFESQLDDFQNNLVFLELNFQDKLKTEQEKE